MFRGRFEHSIDGKGRLSVPAKFREVLQEKFDGDKNLVVVPNERCLEVHPVARWEEIETQVRTGSMFDEGLRELSRLYMSRAREVEIDSAGRVLLPPDSRQQAGLDRDVTLVGGGLMLFEVWDRRRFEDYERTVQHKLPDLFDKMVSRGG
jgi:transcriptional regulator MraZ